MRRISIALALSSLLAVPAAGCDSNPLRPDELAGAYVLQSIDGEPLPVTTYEDATISFHLLADTIRLEADQRGVQVRVTRRDWADPARADDVASATSALGYRVSGRRMEASYGCALFSVAGRTERSRGAARSLVGGDGVRATSCVPTPRTIGRLEGGGLVMYDGASELRYRRVEP